MKKGKLIIIESGSDGSGKATQTKLLFDRLKSDGYNVRNTTFPNYNSESSALVKMYLRGEFGENPDDVNAYAASTFYSVDRFASYKSDWEDFYLNGGIVISDRYTTSNMVHQAVKFKDKIEKDEYLNWLWNLEFELFKLPIPDKVILLDVSPEISRKLIENRPNKITNEQKKDIHESNQSYLLESYYNAKYVCNKYGWERINCNGFDDILDIETIHEKVYNSVLPIIRAN